ncbi:MAG TPA: rod shape-determining protein [Candidatus Pacearchaeota archaeon]|nr:rod shape-determining protein [Candidatus Parcubacteria bacterium]HOC53833.1 rod shape-determining protein [Candidatus Pacearchaeota archaeon]HQM24549.1 rod shape-determining protein [Candidatus Pacearchaeota archaeon]
MWKDSLSKFISGLSQDIAIDLGTANCLVYVRGRGIILSEPSVVAVNKKTNQVLAIGREAEKMVGKTPGHIVAIKPLVSGVISDFEVTEQMLRYLIQRATQEKFYVLKPRVIVGIPSGVTEVEKKAVIDATKSAGAREVFLIEEPMAAAIGARMPVHEPAGNFMVDIGGGTTEVAVISLGGIVVSKSLRIAGNKLNQDIINYAQEKYKLLIGERTAERIKISIGVVFFEKEPAKNEIKEMPMRGRNLVTGLPEEVTINQLDVKKAMDRSINQIISEIKNTIELTPPELLSDIMKKGICLAGGGALLRGLDKMITKETKMPCYIVEDPMTAVARGAGLVLENIDEYHDVLVEIEELQPPK